MRFGSIGIGRRAIGKAIKAVTDPEMPSSTTNHMHPDFDPSYPVMLWFFLLFMAIACMLFSDWLKTMQKKHKY